MFVLVSGTKFYFKAASYVFFVGQTEIWLQSIHSTNFLHRLFFIDYIIYAEDLINWRLILIMVILVDTEVSALAEVKNSVS